MTKKPLIALDGDGVLLDYNLAYAGAWQKATGRYPAQRDVHAYWAVDRWDVELLEGDSLARFRACFDMDFWRSVPPVASALQACLRLHAQGYELVCVTALKGEFSQARLRNLQDHGFPIEKVFATTGHRSGLSPKAELLAQLKPIAFVDDYLPYMKGVDPGIHRALILREPNGSPNDGDGLTSVDSSHASLAMFAEWWLEKFHA